MENIKNKIIKDIVGLHQDSENIEIVFEDGTSLVQYHCQDCCESVLVEQVDGDIQKHIGAFCYEIKEKIVESGDDEFPDDIEYYESCTATFYTLVTSRGYLDWRWVGESNGYYSESVECALKDNNEQ